MSRFLDLVRERVVVYDGAFGTFVQTLDLTADDFGGPELEGCNEILNVTRPDVVREVHEAYFEVGVDCVETNTFGANLGNLGEYDIADRIGELALAGARVAREAADAYSTPERPRWVLGSNPGTVPASAQTSQRASWLRIASRTPSHAAFVDRTPCAK